MITAAGWIALDRRRPAPAPAPPSDTAAVRLLVERDNGEMRLRWNPDAPEIRSAASAVLYVTDGDRESRLKLDPPELRGGVATYWPQAASVTFRLELDDGAFGEIHVSAESRPSPFHVAAKPPPPPAPHPHPIRTPRARLSADRDDDDDDDEPPPPHKPSRIGRAVRKIPLLRRLKK